MRDSVSPRGECHTRGCAFLFYTFILSRSYFLGQGAAAGFIARGPIVLKTEAGAALAEGAGGVVADAAGSPSGGVPAVVGVGPHSQGPKPVPS